MASCGGLRTGAPWADLPDRYPSCQTWHRRFQHWVRSGVMTRIMAALAYELTARGGIEVREASIDASFAPAKKGALNREDKTRQGNKDRGSHRSSRTADFGLGRECLAS